ncbi:MAG: flagellar biosynthetic protein FliR [Buchnera aphidicola (Brevicoryne brassicae)]|uniref:Flagellar biosynthetic protein FliR n=1 Tax=Buchnera aphidicola (Brevicoryne brassicae) TaxID=911343 RepID=A0AAJ5PU87_9GAMM|nr:flagellar biosynthetic protein FliR [Buchnera aphidicola]QCI19666.1 flagellar biosynthetic protein FliR [Buchnera aphidicola (Brevicoryne brassicae)]WAI19034.1 MAG: flagellar biosynthetic protein FliR [Buchnera aphidicola (Brevicoryne brassicae)]
MLTFNDFQLMTFISNFFWPMVRILSFFSIAPVFNDKLVSKKSKIILAVMISFLVSPFLPEVQTILFSYFGFLLLFQQILIGIVLGFIAQLLFVTANLAGEIIGLQMGLSFATFFNKSSYIGTTVISRLLNILIFLFFLVLNTHLYLISMLIDSFYSMPVDNYVLNSTIFFTLLQFFGHVFLNSVLFILPIIIILLMLSFIMSILNRLSPQISLFSIGFPLNLLVGMFSLYFLISITFPYFEKVLHELIFFISHIFLNI